MGQLMHPVEVQTALDGMVLLVDSREQPTEQARQRLKQTGVPTERGKLDFGDYSARFPLNDGSWLDLRDRVVIERKMHIDELAMCFSSERKRFKAEFERAKKAGARIYLLVEGATWEKIYSGKYRSKMSPQSLSASIMAYMARYDCIVVFCSFLTSGKLIHDILYREAKEIMEGRDAACVE